MNRLCIYHRIDLDGQCSAAIVRRKYPDAELFGWNYGDEIPWGLLEDCDEVILVDVSFGPYVMLGLETGLRKNRNVVWIDHHKSAIADAERGYANFPGIRRDGTAACELTWEFFFPDQVMPMTVWMLGRWDVWAWPNLDLRDEIEAFQFGLRSVDTRPENDEIWKPLLDGDSWYGAYINTGKAIISYRNQQNERLSRSSFETEIDGHRVLALNAGGGSTTFDPVWKDHPDCVAMLSFFWTGTKWTCSLYSDRGFDCSNIAKNHGGGGHAGAAGFQCAELPFAPFVNVTITTADELKSLCSLLMFSDPWPIDSDSKLLLENFANREANKYGYCDWIDAYHFIPNDFER